MEQCTNCCKKNLFDFTSSDVCLCKKLTAESVALSTEAVPDAMKANLNS